MYKRHVEEREKIHVHVLVYLDTDIFLNTSVSIPGL